MTINEFINRILPIRHQLFRLASRLLGRREEAEDAVQETLIKLWNKRKNLHEYRSINALAITIIKNHCLDQIKSKGFQASVNSRNINLQSETNSLDKQLEITDQIEIVKQLIDQLPSQQKVIIHLRDIEGLDYEEIADITGQSINNLRVNISRARRKIRDQLIKMQQYEYQRN
ncbi:MAG: RNA polymerase sigma factor [Bacteroidales bacterium]